MESNAVTSVDGFDNEFLFTNMFPL